jgi:hypothetical protein
LPAISIARAQAAIRAPPRFSAAPLIVVRDPVSRRMVAPGDGSLEVVEHARKVAA